MILGSSLRNLKGFEGYGDRAASAPLQVLQPPMSFVTRLRFARSKPLGEGSTDISGLSDKLDGWLLGAHHRSTPMMPQVATEGADRGWMDAGKVEVGGEGREGGHHNNLAPGRGLWRAERMQGVLRLRAAMLAWPGCGGCAAAWASRGGERREVAWRGCGGAGARRDGWIGDEGSRRGAKIGIVRVCLMVRDVCGR